MTKMGFLVAGMCLAWGRVWAEVLGQGETLALIPNMMYNLTVITLEVL